MVGAVGLVALTGCDHVFPIQPANIASYGRSHHDYPAADIFAPCGSTVVAPVAGAISEITTVDTWDPKVDDGATRGGLSVTLIGDDGVRYYGSHLSAIDPAIAVGVRVAVGQPVGLVGNTGNARGDRVPSPLRDLRAVWCGGLAGAPRHPAARAAPRLVARG